MDSRNYHQGKSFFEKDDPTVKYCVTKSVHETELDKKLKEETLSKAEWYIMLGAPEVLQLGKNFIQLIGAKKVLDFGTFTGASAAAFASALPEDGKVLTMDISHDALNSIGMPLIDQYPEIKKKIDFRKGPALEIVDELIKNGESGKWDFAFIDADKPNYPNYYNKAVELVRSGGVIIVDNALFFGTVVNEPDKDDLTRAIVKVNEIIANDPRTNSMIFDIADGIHLAFKK
uniref:O-methyltransferase n=1 Tax=Panagrolaimus superbus TaxID=310955 RepID=A0A914YTL4_9BILA